MKKAIKILTPVLLMTGGLAGIAMTYMDDQDGNGNDEPKRYEVIHTNNGVTNHYDTILPAGSNYSVENYLADLGIDNSDHVEIIQLDQILNDMETFVMQTGDVELEKDVEMIVKKIDFDSKDFDINDANVKKKIVIEHKEEISGDNKDVEVKEIRVESDGEVNIEQIRSQLEAQGLKPEMIDQIMEQMSNVEQSLQDNQFLTESEIEMVISDDSTLNMENINMDEHVVFEKNEPNRKIKVAMIGDANSTVVIVSKANENTQKSAKAEAKEDLQVSFFPNPAQDNFTLSFENNKSSSTKISITDLSGKEVFAKDLGKVNGQVKEQINTADWKSGVYMIHIRKGKDITTKKLIIQ